MPSAKKTRQVNKDFYLRNAEKCRKVARLHYGENREQKKAAAHANYKQNAAKIISSTRACYQKEKESICAYQRDKYALSEPKPAKVKLYMRDMQTNMLDNTETKSKLITAFKKQQAVVKRVTGKAVCIVAAKRLVTKALQVRKEHAGSLLKIV